MQSNFVDVPNNVTNRQTDTLYIITHTIIRQRLL